MILGNFKTTLSELSSIFSETSDEENTAKNILSTPIEVSKTYGIYFLFSIGSKYFICLFEYFS